jgi:multidrug efflux pump subunit AcrB
MQANFGFMVILGLYALAGIIINNAVILIDRINIERKQIECLEQQTTEQSNQQNFEAVINASLRRLRPILMSTCTTIIGLMPLILSKDVLFYGQASTIAFGLAMGTILTLGFVPVVYTFFFKIKPVKADKK